jgi:DivIVA domain-containing protein
MSLTPDDVRSAEFGTAPIGRRGYSKREVEEFVERLALTLEGEDDVTAAEVHHVAFGRPPIGKRGYDERDVDEFLDNVEDVLAERSGLNPKAHRVPAARAQSQAAEQRAEPMNPSPATLASRLQAIRRR